MVTYLILIVTSILVGFTAVLLYRQKGGPDQKVFLTGALLNAGAMLGLLLYRRYRRHP